MLHLQSLAGGDGETLGNVNDSALVVYLASGIDIAAVECDYGLTGLGSGGGVEGQLLQVKLAGKCATAPRPPWISTPREMKSEYCWPGPLCPR